MKGIWALADARPGQERAGRLARGRSTNSGEKARERGGDGDGMGIRWKGLEWTIAP
jgi:hypothetical protein